MPIDSHTRLLLKKCLLQIEQQLGWGESTYWADADFQKLSALIHQQTGILISITTLKRIWGKVAFSGSPSVSTLDALAVFLGFENWRSYASREGEKLTSTISYKSTANWKAICTAVVLIGIGISYFIYQMSGKGNRSAKESALSPEDFDLSTEGPVGGIPASVVFNYNAQKATTDSVFIQQHWDPARRVKVSKTNHTHTSIYYEPGHFNAKLIVEDQVVKEFPLLIATEGWMATANIPGSLPIYLEKVDFEKANEINVQPATMEKYGINPRSDLAEIKLYEVGGFKPIPTDDFVFSAQVKSNSLSARDPCKYIETRLVTERHPILIPLSAPGCISNLMVSNVDSTYSGKEQDFSGFGQDTDEWVRIKCVGAQGLLSYYVNETLVFQVPAPLDKHIIGMIFKFSGGGSVRDVQLCNSSTSFRSYGK